MESNKTEITPVIVFAPNVLAGAERVVITGTIALFELGLKPHLIVIQETRAPHHADYFVKQFPSGIRISLVKSVKALDFKLSSQIEHSMALDKNIVIHTHGFKALVACRLLKGKYKHVHTHHGNTSHTFKVKLYEWMADFAMKRCQHVISVSEAMKIKLLHTLSPYKKITAIPNMLSFKDAGAIRTARRNASSSNTFKEKINLIFIGRLSPEKGLLPFLNNLNSSSLRHKFTLTVLGDGEEASAAKEFVKNSSLDASVFFKGFVNNPSDYLKTADVLVLPSFTEGLPMTLIEALASGLPVVANDVGAIKSLLLDNQNGHLTKSNDYREWEAAFIKMQSDLITWQEYALAHAEDIEKAHSAKTWAEKTWSLYQQLT